MSLQIVLSCLIPRSTNTANLPNSAQPARGLYILLVLLNTAALFEAPSHHPLAKTIFVSPFKACCLEQGTSGQTEGEHCAAALGSMRKLMHFLNIRACKDIFGVSQNKTMNLKMSINMHSLMFMVVYGQNHPY